jgi:hypothetical protein
MFIVRSSLSQQFGSIDRDTYNPLLPILYAQIYENVVIIFSSFNPSEFWHKLNKIWPYY